MSIVPPWAHQGWWPFPNCKFIYVDMGENSSHSYGSIFKASKFGKKYMNLRMEFPTDNMLPNFHSDPVFHVTVTKEVLPLLSMLVRPYPRRNSKFSARMAVENAFGIFSQRCVLIDWHIHLNVKHINKSV